MSISENLANAVAGRDIRAIRDCLAAGIVFDVNMTKGFAESLKYCLEHDIREDELYEKHDGRSLEREESMDAFSVLCGELASNFSRERLDAIRRLGRKLRPPEQDSRDGAHARSTSGARAASPSILPIVGLAVGGLLVGGIVGGLIFRKAVVGAVIGGIAGAAAGSIVGKKHK